MKLDIKYTETEWVAVKSWYDGKLEFCCTHPSVHVEQIDFGGWYYDKYGDIDWCDDYRNVPVCDDCQEQLEVDEDPPEWDEL